MIYESKVLEIGEDVEAFLEEKLVVLFNESVPEDLKSVAIVHEDKKMNGKVEVGNFFILGNESFKILAVGDKANETLDDLGHCTIKFAEPSEEDLPGMIIVEDKDIPELAVGMTVKFQN